VYNVADGGLNSLMTSLAGSMNTHVGALTAKLENTDICRASQTMCSRKREFAA
jgi:hypothetical protein